ncbi:MAG TPA: GntR family transcriptional regulator [Chloroflexia bacterium]|nr:GntR family transcriptional regulator [Chloroflexia bacterium]
MADLNKSDHSTALYLQLIAYFRERIEDGSLGPGQYLPSEIELAREHQISRNTVRQAMSVLVQEGLLERVRGRGTFVREVTKLKTFSSASEKRIGVVLMYVADQLNMELLKGIEQAAKSRGYQVSFAFSEEDASQQTRNIERLCQDRVAGLIIFPLSNEADNAAIARLQETKIPLILIDRYLSNRVTDYVVVDNFGGGYRATQHLLILGHTRIGFVGGNYFQTSSVQDRWQGYRAALLDYNLPYDQNLVSTFPASTENEDGEAYLAYLSRLDRPGAVFISTDMQVPAFYKAARQCGLRIPEDLAVVGFDDLSFASYLMPPLTTVAQPRVEMGFRAAHLLITKIENDSEPLSQVVLPTNLVIRESCGARLRIQQSVSGPTELQSS